MVLLVIDVQKGITDERLYGYQQFEDNLKKREIEQLYNILETSSQNGMITMKQYAKKLIEKKDEA